MYGISASSLPDGFPFEHEIALACIERNWWPCLIGAVKLNETGLSTNPHELEEGANPITGLLPNGDNAGHGPMQLTAKWPADWFDPKANFLYAIDEYLAPAVSFWVMKGLQGDALIKCVAASFNAGLQQAWKWHVDHSDVDYNTTRDGEGVPYGARALAHYHALLQGRIE